jgi:hypothetical protein
MKLFLPTIAAFIALAFSMPSASAIVSDYSAMAERLHSDYQYDLLVAFFAVVCSGLLVALLTYYYRIQWGRKSVMTR